MNLYLLKNPFHTSYNCCKEAVVAAVDEVAARETHPLPGEHTNEEAWGLRRRQSLRANAGGLHAWPDLPEDVVVTLLGVAAEGVEAGIICVDFEEA